MPKIHANGLNFHYQQAGEGPDVILIHGVTGDLSIWFLCQAMGTLARSFRVTAYDLRGHGYSEVPPSGYTSADQAGDTLAIMDALEIDRAMLVGHSFGGVIAMHAAALHPGRIEAVVLSDPSFAALRHLEDLGRWGHWQNFREEAAQAGVTLSSEHWYDLAKFFDQVLHLDGERLLRFRQAVGLPGLNRLLRLASTTCGEDAKSVAGLTEDVIFGVTQPVLALFGEFSPFLATADHLARHLPHCVGRRVPGAKHRAPEENAERFVELVYEYLLTVQPSAEVVRSNR
jgi:pimeloyl-ACP methyl ester carboxylesterase